MTISRKKYSAEFKAKVALEAIREEATLSELSSRYGVNGNVISKWKQKALSNFIDIFTGKQQSEQAATAEQIKGLHAKIGELTVEKDFLQDVWKKFQRSGGKK
jgi:transposase